TSIVSYDYYARQNANIAFNNPPPFPCNLVTFAKIHVDRPLADSNAAPPSVPGSTTQAGSFVSQPSSLVCNRLVAFRYHQLVLPVSGSALLLTPTVGGSFELMTPGLQDVPGRPRFFVHGDTTMAVSFDRNVAKQGSPTGAVIPVSPLAPEVETRGLGAKTSGQVERWVFGAGAGPAFTFEAFERRMRVRPSVEWMREQIQVSGVLNKAYQVDTGQTFGNDVGARGSGPLTQQINAQYLDPITIRARQVQPFSGIGPGLELEMDAGHAGPVMLSLFLGGPAYRMLGDLHLQCTGQT